MNRNIKFGTDGWRAVIGADFTFDNLSRVTEAAGIWLKNKYENPSVLVGYDTRFNGAQFADSVVNRLLRMGVRVLVTPGTVSTPMVSLATAQRQLSAGIIITASHNPPEYSGFKLKGDFGGPMFPAMIAEIEALIPETAADLSGLTPPFEAEFYDAEALYINHLRQTFDIDLIKKSGLKLGYDAMFGAGQKVIRRLFPDAYCYRCEYNPSFLGQAPEPIEKNLTDFSQAVVQNGIDWGLATDGDADRIGLFDSEGTFVDSHHLILLLMYYLAEVKGQKGKIISTFSCTEKIVRYAASLGLESQVTPIGFKYIGEIMAHEPVLVGGEESGGIAVAGHIPERDGIYIGLMILELMVRSGKSLPELVREVYNRTGSFAVVREDLHIDSSDKTRVQDLCRTAPPAQIGSLSVVKVSDLDGYKFHLGNETWVLVRPSGTEPVLRIYAEADDARSASRIIKDTMEALGLGKNI